MKRYFRQTSPERVERGWRAIAPRLRKRPSRRMYAIAAFAALLLAAIFVAKPWSKPPTIEGTVLETDEGQTQTVILTEGSHVVLGPSSRLALVNVSAERVRLRLDRGVIDVEATHRAGRTFTITAKQIDIDVVGTRFHVDVGDASGNADVTVTEGRVKVTSHDDPQHPRFLGAGESWSTRAASVSSAASPPAVSIAAADAGTPHLAPQRPRLSPKFLSLYRDGRYNDAYAIVGHDEFAARCAVLDADGLFTLAETARLSNHPRDAAVAFDALRTRFRTDTRAPLAALESGRLQLDELDDPRAAKAALEDAIALQPDGFFREDADARRVQALEEIGDRAECEAARDQYLGKYPHGSHRASVAKRCR